MLHPTHTHRRVLLALDGDSLNRELLGAALSCCVHLTSRLDILLINPPEEPTSKLAVLLRQLEHSGVDYRLASAHGRIGEEVARYLRRHRGIATVVVSGLEQLAGAPLAQLGEEGHRFIGLIDQAKPIGA